MQLIEVDADVVVTIAEHEPTFGTKFAPKTVTIPPPYALVGTRDATTGILLTTLNTSLVAVLMKGLRNVTCVSDATTGKFKGRLADIKVVFEVMLQLRSEYTSKLNWHEDASSGKLMPRTVIGNVTTADGGETENTSTALFIMVRLYSELAKKSSCPKTKR